jgi:hypothetical protein
MCPRFSDHYIREHPDEHEHRMNAVYLNALISKIRAIHPGMGLRAMYEQYQPEGLVRSVRSLLLVVR